MIRNKTTGDRLVSGLRTRFLPKSRISAGLISMAPWLNIILLIIMFVMIDSRLAVQPGVVISIPGSSFSGGFRAEMVAVVRCVEKLGERSRFERIFFDDESFVSSNDQQMKKLAGKLAEAAARKPSAGLVIMADERVWYGTLVKMFNMASEAGIAKVNLAVREVLPPAEAVKAPNEETNTGTR